MIAQTTVKVLKWTAKANKTVKVLKPEVRTAIEAAKHLGKICLSTGALFVVTELIRGNSKDGFKIVCDDTSQTVNAAKNAAKESVERYAQQHK